MFHHQRTFLFLQGPPSPFFQQLAQRLLSDGHRVVKLHFQAGDALFWHHSPALFHRLPLGMLDHTLTTLWREYGVTDQILFRDARPWHAIAAPLARRYGIRNHVFDEGYLAPDWITLEREGSHERSLLPHDPEWYHQANRRLAPALPARATGDSRTRRGLFGTLERGVAILNPLLRLPGRYSESASPPPSFERVPRDGAATARSFSPRAETSVWAPALRATNRRTTGLAAPYFLLSLSSSSRSGDRPRGHSAAEPSGRPTLAFSELERVIASFARHGPPACRLLLVDPRRAFHRSIPSTRRLRHLARRWGLEGRLGIIGPPSTTAVSAAAGWVTPHLPQALLALQADCPAFTLAALPCAFSGLAASQHLDRFWHAPPSPDASLVDIYRRVLIHATQLNGDFYSPGGRALAVINAAPRLIDSDSPLETLLRHSYARVAY
ncbi:hypothetical protein [Salinicola halophilus]|uniref:capsular polysaccharide export protein, LipB/KpsS family n=1 Tax=Salinicola halophilus TaxID=184065 RepID=UPI0013A5F6BE|nr:hypothetical protein [Salinicola halophilus]